MRSVKPERTEAYIPEAVYVLQVKMVNESSDHSTRLKPTSRGSFETGEMNGLGIDFSADEFIGTYI